MVTRPVEVLATTGAATVGGLLAVLVIGVSPVFALPGIVLVGLITLFASRER